MPVTISFTIRQAIAPYHLRFGALGTVFGKVEEDSQPLAVHGPKAVVISLHAVFR